MMGSAAAVVAEVGGMRRLIGMDKGHKLEIHVPGTPAQVIESRPVTEFSAAVDSSGRLHIAAWLLSRHLMYYTSADGESFTRSTLLKSDGGLRLKDCLVFADTGVSVVYVAETEYANTLVCYHFDGGDWEGRRIVEVDLPQRITAWQFDGSPGGAAVVYSVKDAGHTVVMARPVSGDTAPETVATITGSLSDFCALTSGGARQACWLVDGHLMVNGLRQTEEPWSRTWPCLRRGETTVQCLWLENGMLSGIHLSTQRSRLRPAAIRDPLPCMLALPGELRKAIVDGQTLLETSLLPEMAERQPSMKSSTQPGMTGKETGRSPQGDITLTDVVRNQAIYITRMQDSLSAMERNMLRMQSEVNRLTREVSAALRAKEPPLQKEPQMRAAAYRPEVERVQPDAAIKQAEAEPAQVEEFNDLPQAVPERIEIGTVPQETEFMAPAGQIAEAPYEAKEAGEGEPAEYGGA